MERFLAIAAITLLACSRDQPKSYGEGAELMDLEQALEQDECPPAPLQSPIDLPWLLWPRDLPTLRFAYGESGVDVTNTGRSIQYAYAPGSKLVIEGHAWELVQFHFHARSEHAIGGTLTPLELHLVHRDAAQHLLVVGVRIVRGRANPTLRDALWSELPEEVGERVQDADATFDASEFLPRGLSYRYTGSLTAPPCSGGVSWIVFRKPIEASRRQIEQFTALYPDNYRPLQAREGRPIELGL